MSIKACGYVLRLAKYNAWQPLKSRISCSSCRLSVVRMLEAFDFHGCRATLLFMLCTSAKPPPTSNSYLRIGIYLGSGCITGEQVSRG